jgi:hypothetical protein
MHTTSIANASRTPIRSITITRAEGFEEELITRAFEGPQAWRLAAEELRRWARTAPDRGGYDKCDFAIVWHDGTTYEGRYDLQRGSDGDLGAQVRGVLAWVIEGELGADQATDAHRLLATVDLGAW